MQWKNFNYYQTFPHQFTSFECRAIVNLRDNLQQHTSKMPYIGGYYRDCELYWLDTAKHSWINERLIDLVRAYNDDMRFDVDLNLGMAQLTAYHPGQFYEWHTDLGVGDTSLRKISVVVELLHSEDLTGGGLEILNQNVQLQPGDAVVFPSFALHRALPVTSGVRWSLVQWVLGPEPFK